MGLNEILNVAIPIAIGIFFIAVIYKAMPKQINQVLQWIKNLFGWTGEKVSTVVSETSEGGITYR